MNSKIWKLAISGAIASVAINYFIQPSVNKTLNLK